MRIVLCAVAAAILSAGLTSCSDPEFTVKGNIADGSGKMIILEKPDHAGIWTALDSVEIKKSGDYTIRHIAPADPEIYRLRLGDGFVYFPVDSVETITIDAPADRFATDFTLSGTDQAVAMGKFEKELIAAAPRLSHPDSANNFKRHVFTTYLKDARGSVVSYYILTKTVNDNPLFSIPADAKYFAAVATAIREYRPDDPRLELLTRTATSARRTAPADSTRRKVMEAHEISFIDIDLPSTDGKDVKLSQIAGKGEPTVLIFSDLSNPETPALNAELRKLTGVRIYNVGFDDDQLQWRNAAVNLPWTCVYANDSEASRLVGSYNIGSLPTMYVLDGAGNLKARCASLDELRRNL